MPSNSPASPQLPDYSRDWRIPAGVLLTGTAIAFLVVVLHGSGRPDPASNGNGAGTDQKDRDDRISRQEERQPVKERKETGTDSREGKSREQPKPSEKPAPMTDDQPGMDKERPEQPEKQPVTIADLIANAKQLKSGAIEELAAVGTRAIPAILAELRRDDRRFSWATAAMARMGPDAVGPVAELIGDSDYFMRKIAYLTLGQMGPIALPAVPALQRAAQQDTDPRNRGLAASAISQITRR